MVQKHSWEAPGSSVALPESSGKVAEGFGRVLNGKYWFFLLVFEAPGGVRQWTRRPGSSRAGGSWDPLNIEN